MRDPRPLPVRILPHLLLLAVLAVEALAWTGWHQGEEQLEVQAESGTPAERVWALHVLTNRDPDHRRFRNTYVRGLLNDPDPLVVDFAFTIDLCRIQHIGQEMRITRRLKDEGSSVMPPRDAVEDWWRRYVFYRRKVGGRRYGGAMRLQRDEVAWYFDAVAGRELDEEELILHTLGRQLGSKDIREERQLYEEDGTRVDRGAAPAPEHDDQEDS